YLADPRSCPRAKNGRKRLIHHFFFLRACGSLAACRKSSSHRSRILRKKPLLDFGPAPSGPGLMEAVLCLPSPPAGGSVAGAVFGSNFRSANPHRLVAMK